MLFVIIIDKREKAMLLRDKGKQTPGRGCKQSWQGYAETDEARTILELVTVL